MRRGEVLTMLVIWRRRLDLLVLGYWAQPLGLSLCDTMLASLACHTRQSETWAAGMPETCCSLAPETVNMMAPFKTDRRGPRGRAAHCSLSCQACRGQDSGGQGNSQRATLPPKETVDMLDNASPQVWCQGV